MALPFPLNLIPWDMFPSIEQSAPLVVVEFAIVFGFAYLAGWLKESKGVSVAYTRKIFHFAIFTTAGVMMWYSGYGMVLFLGGISAIFIVIACWKGDGFVLYEGIAREGDAPHRTLFIIVPFLATAIGGIVSIAFFGTLSIVGFFVAGWGDAAGEPVGERFGRHRVSLPFFGHTSFTRSLEGSVGIFITSYIAAGIALGVFLDFGLYEALLIGFPVALCAMAVEFFSPHGIDNFSVMVVAALAASWSAGLI